MFIKPRVQYLDIIKTIAIFLVCCIHYVLLNPNKIDNFFDMICYAGVSLFFMVNGALLFNSSFNLKNHLKKTLHLLVVLFFWELISIFYFFTIYHVNYSTVTITDFISYLLGNICWTMPTGHFWFIIALVSVYIVFPLLKFCFDSPNGKPILIFIVGTILILHFLTSDISTLQIYLNKHFGVKPIDITILSSYSPFGNRGYILVYFIFGGMLHNYLYIQKNKIHHQRLYSALAIIIGWVLIYFLKGIETGFSGSEFTNLSNGYARFGTVLLAVGFFCLINTIEFKNKAAIKAVTIVSQNTLGIYYIHCLYLSIISLYIYQLIPMKGIFINGIKAFLVLILSLMSALIIKKIPIVKKLLS